MARCGAGERLERGMGREEQPGRLPSALGGANCLPGRGFRLPPDAVDGVEPGLPARRVMLQPLGEAGPLRRRDPVHVAVQLGHALLEACALTADERGKSGLSGSKFPQSCGRPQVCTGRKQSENKEKEQRTISKPCRQNVNCEEVVNCLTQLTIIQVLPISPLLKILHSQVQNLCFLYFRILESLVSTTG